MYNCINSEDRISKAYIITFRRYATWVVFGREVFFKKDGFLLRYE